MDNATLSLSYNSLWKLLIDRKLKKKDLQNIAHLSSSVIAKMGKDQPVHLDTIVKICVALQCDISDVVTLCIRRRNAWPVLLKKPFGIHL